MFVVRPWLVIGKYRETLNKSLLDQHGIGAMLQLAEAVSQPGIESLYLDVDDGIALPEGALKRGVEFVHAQKARGKTVLVACGAGISRSTTFAIAALSEDEGISIFDAYHAIIAVHPDATPHPELWVSLANAYGMNKSLPDLFDEIRKITG